MPFKLIAPLEKDFTLDVTDKKYGTDGTPTTLRIVQATQRAHERRSRIFSEIQQRWDKALGVIMSQNWCAEELKRIEAYLTMAECNILRENGKPLFKFKKTGPAPYIDMTDSEFEEAWGQLPQDIAEEIHDKVLEVNPDWQNPFSG